MVAALAGLRLNELWSIAECAFLQQRTNMNRPTEETAALDRPAGLKSTLHLPFTASLAFDLLPLAARRKSQIDDRLIVRPPSIILPAQDAIG